MEHTIWLSKADVCALQRAESMVKLLETHLPPRDVKTVAARMLTLKSFRDVILQTCFRGKEVRDHVLITVSSDTLAVLEAMGLCRPRDAEGRRICSFLSSIKAPFVDPNKSSRKGLLDVLVRQYSLLLGLEPRGASWTGEATQELLGKALKFKIEGQLARVLEYAKGASFERLQASACELQRLLAASIKEHLQRGSEPAQLLEEFRSKADCPPLEEAKRLKGADHSWECQRVVNQHARLFAARLTESVVMQAISFLSKDTRARLKKSWMGVQAPLGCDFAKMRLAWTTEKGVTTYQGNAKDIANSTLNLSGLDAYTKWPNGRKIQDALTLKTKDLSRLSDDVKNRSVHNVWSDAVLDIQQNESNQAFDAAYHAFVKPAFLPASEDVCRTKRSYIALGKAELLSEKELPIESLQILVSLPLSDNLKILISGMNEWEKAHPFNITLYTRSIKLEVKSGEGSAWFVPLTKDKNESLGLYQLITEMICEDKGPPNSKKLICEYRYKNTTVKTLEQSFPSS